MRMKTSITQGLLSGQKPTEILHRACETFGDEPESFATAVLVIVDTRDDSIEWVNAGHPAPILLNTADEVRRLEQTGPLVSWLIGSWSTRKVSFQPGDLCLAFTDGLSESRTPEGNELGASALEAMVRRAATANDPAEVTARLLAEIRERSGDLGRDDVTVVGIRRGLLVRG